MRPHNRALFGIVAAAAVVGCASSTAPLMGPVEVRVTASSASPGATLPVRLRGDGGSWFVNRCGYHFQVRLDGEWQRPLPVPPPCSDQPNVAVESGTGTAVNVLLPDDMAPGTYRIVFLVNLGRPLDGNPASLAEELYVPSNPFSVLPLF